VFVRTRLLSSLLILFIAIPLQVRGDSGFRLLDGRLLQQGMNRIDVLTMIGQPLAKDIESYGVNIAPYYRGRTIETWSYILQGSIGGYYMVSITFKGGIVVNIRSKQRGRM